MPDTTTHTHSIVYNLDPWRLAWLALADASLLTVTERADLAEWRARTSDAHVIARIDALLA